MCGVWVSGHFVQDSSAVYSTNSVVKVLLKSIYICQSRHKKIKLLSFIDTLCIKQKFTAGCLVCLSVSLSAISTCALCLLNSVRCGTTKFGGITLIIIREGVVPPDDPLWKGEKLGVCTASAAHRCTAVSVSKKVGGALWWGQAKRGWSGGVAENYTGNSDRCFKARPGRYTRTIWLFQGPCKFSKELSSLRPSPAMAALLAEFFDNLKFWPYYTAR